MIEKKILEELTRCGAVGMDIEKSCAIVDISEKEFYDSPEAQKAYQIGSYKGEYLWRQSIFKGTQEGNPQMCKIFQTFMQETVMANNPSIRIEDYYRQEDVNESAEQNNISRFDGNLEEIRE